MLSHQMWVSSETKGAKGKAMRLEVPRAQPYWGAELPGQMPGIAGAILGGKAQERIPDPARELVGIYGSNLSQVSSKRRVLNQDFVQW